MRSWPPLPCTVMVSCCRSSWPQRKLAHSVARMPVAYSNASSARSRTPSTVSVSGSAQQPLDLFQIQCARQLARHSLDGWEPGERVGVRIEVAHGDDGAIEAAQDDERAVDCGIAVAALAAQVLEVLEHVACS